MLIRSDRVKGASSNVRDWWVFGVVVLGLGIGGLFNNLSQSDPQSGAFFAAGGAVALGLFLVIESAVARAIHADRNPEDPL